MDILNLFELNSAVSSQVTRNVFNEGLFIPRIYTTSFGNKSLRFSAPLLWNNFIKGHSEFNSIKILVTFKGNLKNFFLKTYSEQLCLICSDHLFLEKKKYILISLADFIVCKC